MRTDVYRCKYCKRKMSKIEYEISDGYCLKCRDIKDWKQILNEQKTSPSKQSKS